MVDFCPVLFLTLGTSSLKCNLVWMKKNIFKDYLFRKVLHLLPEKTQREMSSKPQLIIFSVYQRKVWATLAIPKSISNTLNHDNQSHKFPLKYNKV
jgi:hypothetical protein